MVCGSGMPAVSRTKRNPPHFLTVLYGLWQWHAGCFGHEETAAHGHQRDPSEDEERQPCVGESLRVQKNSFLS